MNPKVDVYLSKVKKWQEELDLKNTVRFCFSKVLC